jgi:hypothetical protein
MKKWFQRLRGAFGMGLTWALGWAPVGATVGAVLSFAVPGGPLGIGGVVALNALAFAVLGFVGGTIFATVLGITEGRRRFDQLSLPRFAAWGALGGLLLGLLLAVSAVAGGFWEAYFGPQGVGILLAAIGLGGSSAAGSLAIARRAEDKELLGDGAEVAGVGLSETDRRQLLTGDNSTEA